MTTHDRERIARTSGIMAMGLLASFSVSAQTPDQKPNILFIAVDDLRPELGCYGCEEIKSPNIDRLAARGAAFKRAYCQVAVCGASRASVLTGLRPTKTRFIDFDAYAEKDAPDAMTLPEELQKNGYICLSNGKVFHHKEDTAGRSWSKPPWRLDGSLTFLDPASRSMINPKTKRGPVFEAPDVPDNAYCDGMIADKTIEDLKQLAKEGKPFFLGCGFMRPHLPFYAPKKYWDMYSNEQITVANNQYRPKDAPKALISSTEILSYHNRGIEYNSDEWHRSCRHAYYACVSYVDEQIGKVLKTLDDLNLTENTIIILWGDHGWLLGEHDFWGKHNVMHRTVNAPLILAGPGIPSGQKLDQLVEFVDIYPTLFDLAGLTTVNAGLQGASFVPILKNPDHAWKNAVFSSYGPAISVVTKRYNYAEFKNGEKMLYDLKTDPDENTNLAGKEEYSVIIGRLSQLLANPEPFSEELSE